MQHIHYDVAVILPARIGSVRLPKKFLCMIGNSPMITHVVNRIKETNLPNIFIATDSDLIAERVTQAGGKFIMTPSTCATGTDRVYEAVKILNNPNLKYIINVQGDMPFIEPSTILRLIETLKDSNYDIITPVVKVKKELAEGNSNVKVVIDKNNKALYFSRNLIPSAAEEFLYHVGVYGFKIDVLKQFVNLPTSYLEAQENNLEQLRALENSIDIGVCFVDSVPISVDTLEDLEKARVFYNQTRG